MLRAVPGDEPQDDVGDVPVVVVPTVPGTDQGDDLGVVPRLLPRVAPRTANRVAREQARVEPWGPKPEGPEPRASRQQRRRARVAQLVVECTPGQKAAILAAADAEGVSIRDWVLGRLFDEPAELEY
jgi:hypothetical protein